MSTFLDGTGITPGTDGCNCDDACGFPCWQRLGIAESCPFCGCPEFPEDAESDNAETEHEVIELTEGSNA